MSHSFGNQMLGVMTTNYVTFLLFFYEILNQGFFKVIVNREWTFF